MHSDLRVAVGMMTGVAPPPLRLDAIRARARTQAGRAERRLRTLVIVTVFLCITGLAFGVARVGAPRVGAPIAAMTPAPTIT